MDNFECTNRLSLIKCILYLLIKISTSQSTYTFPWHYSYFIVMFIFLNICNTYGGGWMICHFSTLQVQLFLLIEFHFTFSIFCKIKQFIIIVFWIGNNRPSGFLFTFVPALLLSILTPLLILTKFVCFFILFHSCCSHAKVFGKTLVHEFHISSSRTEWYLFFFRQCNY